MKTPFRGLGIRFQESVHSPEDEGLPDSVSLAAQDISREKTAVRFVLLRTECWDVSVETGINLFSADASQPEEPLLEYPKGEGALRRLIGHLGVDLGASAIFEPLLRDFPRKKNGN